MRRRGHAIMIALPYQGHITPFVSLAIKIASNGVVVTFVHLEFIDHTLSSQSQPTPFSKARESGLDIRYTTISDGFPVEYNRDNDYWESMLLNFSSHVDEFVGKIIRSDPDLAPFLVADTLFTWPAAIAEKYNLLNVSFWTEPALVFSLTYHLDMLREKGHFPCKDSVEEEIYYIPGVKSVNTKDLMPYLKESGTGTIVQKVETKAFEEVKKAANSATKSLWSECDCSQWLSTKSPGSVLYVSFGSFLQASEEVIKEIAYGLLLSQVNFIWVVRAGAASSDDALPSEFRDEIKDKGLIVQWCNQIMVLSDPAVGGFLTHCGWNSVLESIWCGVPMICYPLDYDQLTNRKLLVDDWKIGINFCEGESVVDRKEVAENIKNFMNGAVSENLRQEVKKVTAKLRNAVESDGSSEVNFDQFMKDLKAKLAGNAEQTPLI